MEDKLDSETKRKIRLAVGTKVRRRRENLGISQEALGFQSSLHRTYVGSVERGERNISIENVCSLARAMACEPVELVPTWSLIDQQSPQSQKRGKKRQVKRKT